MMDVNYFGSIFATRAVIPEMKKRQLGRVVFLSSQAGQVGLFGFTGYSATKFALRGLAEALQMEVCQFPKLTLLACIIRSNKFGKICTLQMHLTDVSRSTVHASS